MGYVFQGPDPGVLSQRLTSPAWMFCIVLWGAWGRKTSLTSSLSHTQTHTLSHIHTHIHTHMQHNQLPKVLDSTRLPFGIKINVCVRAHVCVHTHEAAGGWMFDWTSSRLCVH